MAETKRCPYCGEEILAVAKKCKHCGEWLEEKKEEPKKQVPCEVCGEMIDEDALECPYCHEEVVSSNDLDLCDTYDECDLEDDVEEKKRVYGFYEHCFVEPIIRNYANFRDEMGVKQYWLTFLAVNILGLGVYGLGLIIASQGMDYDDFPEDLLTLYCTLILLPFVAMMWRRLNDLYAFPTRILKFVGYLTIFFLYMLYKILRSEVLRSGEFTFIELLLVIGCLPFLYTWGLNIVLAYWLTKEGYEDSKLIKFKAIDWIVTIVLLSCFFIGCFLEPEYYEY